MAGTDSKKKEDYGIAVRIDSQLHRRLKIRCAQTRETMREFLDRLIREALSSPAKEG